MADDTGPEVRLKVESGIIVGTERIMRSQGGAVAEGQLDASGDRWNSLLGDVMYWSSYRRFKWLTGTPYGLQACVWRWYPRVNAIVDSFSARDDGRLLPSGMRGQVTQAEAQRRRKVANEEGILYLSFHAGEQVNLAELLELARASLAASARAEPEPEKADDGGIYMSPLSSDEDVVIGGLKKSGDRGSA